MLIILINNLFVISFCNLTKMVEWFLELTVIRMKFPIKKRIYLIFGFIGPLM